MGRDKHCCSICYVTFWDIFVCLVVRKQCLKVIPEESHSVDEQIIPAKTRYSNIRQYNPKKPVKWGFKNMVRAGSSGMMYDFYIYTGKGSSTDVPEDAKDLQKCAQAVAKVCLTLPTHANHKLFVNNWFTTLDHLRPPSSLPKGTRHFVMRNCSSESPTRLPLEIKQRAESIWSWFSGL